MTPDLKPISLTESAKRAVLIRGVYEEARKAHDARIAFAVLLDFGVSREEVNSHLGCGIGELFQIYAGNVKNAAKAASQQARPAQIPTKHIIEKEAV